MCQRPHCFEKVAVTGCFKDYGSKKEHLTSSVLGTDVKVVIDKPDCLLRGEAVEDLEVTITPSFDLSDL